MNRDRADIASRTSSPQSQTKGTTMSQKHTLGILTAFGMALMLVPLAAPAATCIPAAQGSANWCKAGYQCGIESPNVINPSTPGVPENLCNDSCDNDENNFQDSADYNCSHEALCNDGIDNDGDLLTDGDDPDCDCLGTAFGGVPGCTANDFDIAYNASPIVEDGCINSDDTLTADLTAAIHSHASAGTKRYDITLWVALTNFAADSADPTSVCTRQALQPIGITDVIGNGPFSNISPDADACGDMQGNVAADFTFPFPIQVPCSDLYIPAGGSAGFVDLRQCGTWDNNSNTTCNGFADGLPGTTSKCQCQSADTTIAAPNMRLSCTDGAPVQLNDGFSTTFNLQYTNVVDSSCVAGNGNGCGTAQYIQLALDYGSNGTNADTYGAFVAVHPISNVEYSIPDCPLTTSVGSPSLGDVCNDTSAQKIIYTPRDSVTGSYGVVSPLGGTYGINIKYTVDNADASSHTLTFAQQIYWSDTTPDSTQFVQADMLLQSCLNCGCSTDVQLTPVTLSSFRATPSGRQVRFDWTTDSEVGNVGFNIYAGRGKFRQRLNREPIPTQSHDSLEPQSYSVTLPVPPGRHAFYIEDLDLRGHGNTHGPFQPGRQYGASVKAEKIDWGSVRRQNGLGATDKARGRNPAMLNRIGAASVSQPAIPSSRTKVGPIELQVDKTGLYRVTFEDLLAAGFDLGRVNSGGLALTVRGLPVPIYLHSGIRFGPGSYFDFWGEALDTIYTHTNVYRLETASKKPLRAGEDSGVANGSAAASYPELRTFERNRGYAFWSSSDDPFYDTDMLVYTSPKSWQFPFTVDQLGSGPATLHVDVYGGTVIDSVYPDHHVQYLVNNVLIGESKFDGASGDAFQAEIPAGLLTEGSNTLTLLMPSVPGAPYDLIEMDKFSVTYPRAFSAQSGRLDFSGDAGRFDVSGLPEGSVAAYRREGRTLTRLDGVTVAPDGGSFAATIPGTSAPASYSVASVGSMLKPAAIQAARPQVDITSGTATYLVISNPLFLSHLDPLVSARESQGLMVKVVDVEDIYSQFSGGVFDPYAIRDYIAHAYRSMGTRYVLLVGGDTYDYLDDLGYGSVSFIPSLYQETSDIVHWAPSDAAFADVDLDGTPDLAIGRFPALTPDELDTEIAKTLQYGSDGRFPGALFAADSTDPGANKSFSFVSDQIIKSLPLTWQTERVYLDNMALANARSSLFADIAAGRALSIYTGHASMTSWGSASLPVSQRLFTVNDIPSLGNVNNPTVVAQLGCWTNYFTHPRTESIGAAFLNQPDVGAAVALGSTTLGEDVNSNRFGALLMPSLTTPGLTIGDAVLQAKRQLVAQSPPGFDLRDILLGWNQLGDPALKVIP